MNQSTLQGIVKAMNLLPIDDDYRAKRLIEDGIKIDREHKYRSECGDYIYSIGYLTSMCDEVKGK